MSMAGNVMVFKGEDTIMEGERLVELCAVYKDGTVELAFDTHRRERTYVRFPVAQLMGAVATAEPEDAP